MVLQRSWTTSLLFLAVIAGGVRPGVAQDTLDPREIEITGSWVRSIEPTLADPVAAAKLGVYDHLAFGKGRFVRIDGKSRKNAVLTLEGEAKFLVRLFDLTGFDTKMLSARAEYYFGGILSKIERNPQGGIEVSVTYSNLSEVEGRFYSRQAREFAGRTQEIRERNEVLLGKAKAEAPVSSQPSESGLPQPPAGVPPTVKPEPAKTSSEEAAEDATEPGQPRNRPVLKRRNRSGSDPAATEGDPPSPAPPVHPTQSADDDDVVIYRRRDGSRRTAKSSSSPDVTPATEDSSDRPVLRRAPDRRELAKEVDGMMLIPEGYTTLGSDNPEDSDKPMHRVLVKSFYIDKHEVSNADYKQFCEATGHRVPPYWQEKNYPKGLDKHPVVQVSWLDATAYARWAGKRLPTETEWERAAKGPNSYRYSYGNTYDPQKANTDGQKASAAGAYPANEFGLFDMTGNASEWTNSLNLPYPYSEAEGREDLKAPGPRTVRGGDFTSTERDSRCLVRQNELSDHGSPRLGFRCARDAR